MPDVPPPTARSILLHLPRGAVWILGGALLAPWLVLLFMLQRPPSPTAPTTAAPTAMSAVKPARTNGALVPCPPGPWGELAYARILVEPPEEFMDSGAADHREARWFFKGYSAAALAQLWQAAGLDEAQRLALDEPARREVTPAGIVVRPTDQLILGLNAAARAKIYTALAPAEGNPQQNEPFRFRADATDEWFHASGLSAKTIALTQQLLYRRGTSFLFSDVDLVLPTLESPAERIRFLKTMSRKSTLLLQMHVRPDADVEALARYWGRGRRAKDVRPLLQSLARGPGGGTIDVAHLLPRFARSLLYTYPFPSDNPTEADHDCHWTALNFFSDQPDERFSNIDVVKQTLMAQYYRAPGEPALGDILVFMRPDGVVVHACVYVAADIVFTKNGASFSMPWILMTLPDVIAFYPADPPLEIRRYRLKDL